MFDKLTCERCGKKYNIKTISENKGKHYCSDCLRKCLVCGRKLPMSNRYGERSSITGAFLGPGVGNLHDSRNETIGSGKCNECFYKEKDQQLQSSTKANVTERLEQLKTLLDKGIITPAEYEKKKAEMLALL